MFIRVICVCLFGAGGVCIILIVYSSDTCNLYVYLARAVYGSYRFLTMFLAMRSFMISLAPP